MDSLIFPKPHSSYDADLPGLNEIPKVRGALSIKNFI